MGDLHHVLGEIDTGHIARHVFERSARQACAAAEVEHAVERACAEIHQALPEDERHVVAEILHQHLVEDVGVLIEKRRDIGFRGAVRRVAKAEARETYRCAAVIVGIDLQHFAPGCGSFVALAGLFELQGVIIGFRQLLLVDDRHACDPVYIIRGSYALVLHAASLTF